MTYCSIAGNHIVFGALSKRTNAMRQNYMRLRRERKTNIEDEQESITDKDETTRK